MLLAATVAYLDAYFNVDTLMSMDYLFWEPGAVPVVEGGWEAVAPPVAAGIDLISAVPPTNWE